MSNGVRNHSIELFETLFRGRDTLDTEAIELIKNFILSEFSESAGAFCNRGGYADLYYTMFGLLCASVLDVKLPSKRIKGYLNSIDIKSLEPVHQCCLIKSKLLLKLHTFGFMKRHFRWYRFFSFFTINRKLFFLDDPYGLFLTINMAQDLGIKLPKRLEVNFGVTGVLSTTVAGVLARRQLGLSVDEKVLDWILARQHESGGFVASEGTTLPDMLSTAVALFCLMVCGKVNDDIAKKGAKFIGEHWLENGGFASVIDDEKSDCEYLFYGLLAIGVVANDR